MRRPQQTDAKQGGHASDKQFSHRYLPNLGLKKPFLALTIQLLLLYQIFVTDLLQFLFSFVHKAFLTPSLWIQALQLF